MKLKVSGYANPSDLKVHGRMDEMNRVQSAKLFPSDQQSVHKSHDLDPVQPSIAFQAGQHTSANTQLLDHAIPPELIIDGDLSRLNAMEHEQNRVAEENQNTVSMGYSKSSWKASCPSNVFLQECSSGIFDSANQVNEISKTEKTEGRSSRKKAKKKKKRKKRSAKNVSSTTVENESIQETSLCDTGFHAHLDCVNADDLVVKSLQEEECTLQETSLSSEGCFTTSKSSAVGEYNVGEEYCTYPAPKDSLPEVLQCTLKGLQGPLGHDSTSRRSVQLTPVALASSSLKSSSTSDCRKISVGKPPNEDGTCINDQQLGQWVKNVSSGMSRHAAKKQNQTSISNSRISDGTGCSTASDMVSYSIECSSHEKTCNLSPYMHDKFHNNLEKFAKYSRNDSDGIKCCSGIVDRCDFVPRWAEERSSKSTQGSSGQAQSFSGYANLHAPGGKNRNHFFWQKVPKREGKGCSSFPHYSNHGKIPEADISESSPLSIRKGVHWRKSKKTRSNDCLPPYERSVQSDSQEADPLPMMKIKTTESKSSEMKTLKSIVESKPEQISDTRMSFLDRNSFKSSTVKEIAFHDETMNVSRKSVPNKNTASGYSHYEPCCMSLASQSVVAVSCSSSGEHDTQADLITAHRRVEPCYSVEKQFENELKVGSAAVFCNTFTKSSCVSPTNDHDKQASTISNLWKIHRDHEQKILGLEDANICEERYVVSHSYDHLSLADAGSKSCKLSGPFYGDIKESESDIYTENTSTVDANIVDGSTCLNCISLDLRKSISENSVANILKVVRESHRIQIECEDIQLATGNCLADFEEVLYAASPTFPPLTCSACNHWNCLSGDHCGNLLCMHQIPGNTLGAIWQWYEEPGCYGLKVKIEDFQRRLELNQHKSYAYFVPLLSSVQLFGRSSSLSSRIRDISGTKMEFLKETLSSRPTTVPNSFKAQDETDESTTATCSDDSVLLFEYFESERPQHRKPFFEKIKELVTTDASSNLQMYGDPSYLENLSLHNLHQASWFSVAWYPIYRMPDDSFRTAFLTYHLLRHLTTRSSFLDSHSEHKSFLVSPVIGLQTYNHQGEGWFSLKNATTVTVQNQFVDPAFVVEKRLRTLEQAALLMSTAAVRKGEHISTNIHPDYDFFVSRRS